jgi:hypothetical protein
MGAVSWLGVIAAVAPVAGAIIYARQGNRDAPKITQELLKSHERLSNSVEERGPARWYHRLSIAALAALPFVQGFAYFEYGTTLGVLMPLAAVLAIVLIVGMFFPRYVVTRPVARGESRLVAATVAAALGVAMVLPPTENVLIARGALVDLLGLLGVTYIIRVWHISRHGASAQDG